MKTMLKYRVVILMMAMAICAGKIRAQILLEDYSGDGALLASGGGFLHTNITKGNVATSYTMMNSDSRIYLGADGSLGLANGLLSALTGGNAQPAWSIAGAVGWFLHKPGPPKPGEPVPLQWLAVRVAGLGHTVSLYDAARPAGHRLYDESYTGLSVGLHYVNFDGGNILWAISGGYVHQDNSATAPTLTVQTVTSTSDTAGHTEEVVTSSTNNVIDSAVYKKSIGSWRLDGDAVWVVIQQKLALQGYVHSTFASGVDSGVRIGFGGVLLKGPDPLNDNVGGIVLEYVGGYGIQSGNAQEHIRINLVGSLAF